MALPGYKATAVDGSGGTIGSAQVEVRRRSDNALASLFDAATSGSALTNPFNADGNGDFEFFAAADDYIITLGAGSSPQVFPLTLINYDEADTRYAQLSGASFTGNVTFGDNGKAIFGSGSDLQLYHNETNSIIADTGAGDLSLQTNGTRVALWDTANSQFLGSFDVGSEVGLYYNGDKKFATTNTGIDVAGIITGEKMILASGSPNVFLSETDVTDKNTRLRNSAGKFEVQTVDDSNANPTLRLRVDNATGDISFYEDTGTTAKLFWDANAEVLEVNKISVDGDADINALTVGRGAGNFSTNAVVGNDALGANTTGVNNTAIGSRSLYSNTEGYNNVAVGKDSLYSNTTGITSAATGRDALYSNTTGSSNTANGYRALYYNTTGDNNTASGYQALLNNTIGTNNTASGWRALRSNTEGLNNVAVGNQAGDVITTGSRNTILGSFADPSALDGSNQVVLGYNLTGKGDQTAFIAGTSGAYNEKNVTTWETTSDQRIKKNIVDNDDGLSVLSQIQVRNFEYRAPDEITDLPSHAAVEQDGVQLGVIAQEIQQVLPECVSENSTGVLSVNTDPLVWYLVNAVKELKAEIEQLKGN